MLLPFSRGNVQHATPALSPPSTYIKEVFHTSFKGQFRVLLYAEVNDRESFAIGVESDGRISGFRRLFPDESEHGIETYPVKPLIPCDISLQMAAQLEKVIVGALKEVRFPAEQDLQTGRGTVYIISSGRFFGQIYPWYEGSAKPALVVCELLVKIMASEGQRGINIQALERALKLTQ